MNRSKGFTIIELIVVIAIIAILAAVVMVSVTQYIQKSKIAAIWANLDTLQVGSATYSEELESGVPNFCNSSYINNVGLAITTANTDFAFSCFDGTGGSMINGDGDGVRQTIDYILPGCVGGKWVAQTQNLFNADIMYCIDSTGGKNLNANASVCECTNP